MQGRHDDHRFYPLCKSPEQARRKRVAAAGTSRFWVTKLVSREKRMIQIQTEDKIVSVVFLEQIKKKFSLSLSLLRPHLLILQPRPS